MTVEHTRTGTVSQVDAAGRGETRLPQPSSCRRAALLVLILVSTLALAADLGSKTIAFRTIGETPVQVRRDQVLEAQRQQRSLSSLFPPATVEVAPNLLSFTLVLNPGAVFGIGAGKRWFFIVFTGAALGLAIWMFAKWTRPRDHFAHAAIGLLIAGGLGNLYDRIVYGCVRDFIHPLPGVEMPFGWRMPISGSREVWPYVSNVADLWLLIGIGMLMWHLWRTGRHDEPQARDAEPSPAH